MADGSPNETYIEKADELVAGLAPGGKLVTEQALDFFEIMTKKRKLLSMASVVTTENPSYEISKLGFTGEVLRPAVEADGLPENDRATATKSKITMTPKEHIAICKISYSTVEDNIIRGRFPEYLKGKLAEAVGRDVEKAGIQGDTAGNGSALLKYQDGFIKKAVSHPVVGGGSRLNKSILTKMMRAMPEEYEPTDDSWVYLTNKNAAIDYWDSFADRQTEGGDAARTGRVGGGSYGKHGGFDIVSIPLWPRNLGVGSNETTVMLLDPKNMHFCFRRDIQIETAKDIKRRMYEIVVTVKFCVEFVHEDAVVQATGILAEP